MTDSPRVRIRVPGIPAPKGSRTPGHRKDGSVFTRPVSAGEKAWTDAVAYCARANRPGGKTLEPPYVVEMALYLPRPENPKFRWPTKGDGDKLERATLDGLVRGNLLVDDRHIIDCRWTKQFVGPAATGALVVVQ